ncbi:MAG: hypothetical protein K2L51_03035 [Clostridiales bacterium]|nr:hypothetical protein [Clostridiales bacterium]
MATCLVIGQNENSRLVSSTERQLRNILQVLVQEKGVREIYAWGGNAFESDCFDLAENMFSYLVCEKVTYYLDAVGLKQSFLRRAILGRWAEHENMQDIPSEIIREGKEKLVQMCDYIIAGMAHESDLLAMAEYGRALGKPVWKVYA